MRALLCTLHGGVQAGALLAIFARPVSAPLRPGLRKVHMRGQCHGSAFAAMHNAGTVRHRVCDQHTDAAACVRFFLLLPLEEAEKSVFFLNQLLISFQQQVPSPEQAAVCISVPMSAPCRLPAPDTDCNALKPGWHPSSPGN